MTQATTTEPCIISVAITGSVPRKKDNPAVPITIAEQIESTHEAYEAGATLVHLHVRDEDEKSSSDRHRFADLQEGIRKHCPDIIIQFSTGGRGRSFEQRGAMLDLKPDMASLATGSVNFPTIVYENPPDFVRSLAQLMLDHDVKPEIEIFDLAMLYSTVDLVNQGLLRRPVHVQFVLGVKNALPARREILEFEVAQLKNLLPDATWTAAGIGRHQLEVNHWTLQMGGHCRTGLEDNVRWDKDTLAKSNAQLVERVAALCAEYGRPVASAKEARLLLSL
ncbi:MULTISPECIES: 3-keto-5-aminohexanoate cleavage protein [unclassified Caballeronia]|uniref:3-keto-5-aminohexanoate cleavage protein n=1 Tax=unclassified Caballeronia TaxID=2646786 RepID=UPI00285D90B9|nr:MULTISPECIES: 3-keto-5-aminohexanoate cleavage protein [unclassified Caballeronia]MDR5739581.1 3-keto-5-aminohexanoate cleavage protein [Caballeronia sp. LZ016]MDR5808048.1 3-keto-5-aminohexanoate cleavage protein [Caballeronia sp. LZ019]